MIWIIVLLVILGSVAGVLLAAGLHHLDARMAEEDHKFHFWPNGR